MQAHFAIPIEEIFKQADSYLNNRSREFFLEPGKLITYLAAISEKHEVKFIDEWDSFETLDIEFSEEDFFNLIYTAIDDGPLYLITDEGIKDKIAFYIESKTDFYKFTDWYTDFYNMRFYQPADHIGFFPREEKVNVIYHEGAFFTADLEK